MGGGGWGPPQGPGGGGGNQPAGAGGRPNYQNIWGVPSPGYVLRQNVRNIDSAFQSGGLPPMDFGSILGMGVSEAIKLQASQANARAMFRDSMGDFEKFKGVIDNMRDSLNKLGYTRANFLDFFKSLGQASGQVGKNLQDSTRDLLTFSRAFNVDPGSLLNLGGTITRSTGMKAETAAGKILGSGVSAAMFDEVANAESQFTSSRMQLGVGGEAGARTFDAMLGFAESMRGTNKVYQGAGGTRIASQVYGMFANAGSLAAMFNPIEPGESYVDWRARLEKPTPEMVRRTMEGARSMGQGGEILLQSLTGMGYSDVVNQRSANLSKITESRRIVVPTEKQAQEGTGPGDVISALYRDRGASNFGGTILSVYKEFMKGSDMFKDNVSTFGRIVDTLANALTSIFPGGSMVTVFATAGLQKAEDAGYGNAVANSPGVRIAKAMGQAAIRSAAGQAIIRASRDNLRIKSGERLSSTEEDLVRYLVAGGLDVYATGGLRTEEENKRVHGDPNSGHLERNGGNALDIRTLSPTQLALANKLLGQVGYMAFNDLEGTAMHTHIQPVKGTDPSIAMHKLTDALDRNTAAMKNPNNVQGQRARGK